MYASDYIQMYAVLLGFYLNNKAWDSLILLGVPYWPFIIIIFKNWLEVKRAGEDDGDPGGLYIRYMTVDLIKMCIVILFFLVPFGGNISIRASNVTMPMCDGSNALAVKDVGMLDILEHTAKTVGHGFLWSNNISDTADAIFGNPPPLEKSQDAITSENEAYLTGISPRFSLAPAIIHNMTTAFSAMVISSMPCNANLRTMVLNKEVNRVPDMNPVVQDAYGEFVKQCYHPSLQKIRETTTDHQYNIKDRLWPGADIFISSAGFYSNLTASIDASTWYRVEAIKQKIPSPNVGGLVVDGSNGGNVVLDCQNVYQDLTQAMLNERKAAEKVNESFYAPLNSYISSFFVSQAEQDETVLKQMLASIATTPHGGVGTGNGLTENISYGQSESNLIKDIAVVTGVGVSGFFKSADVQAKRIMVPILFSTLTLLTLFLTPIIITLSGYSIKATMTMAVTILIAATGPLCIATADWMDTTFISIATGNGAALVLKPVQTTIVEYMGLWMYEYLPMVWIGVFAILGHAIGGPVANAASGIGSGTGQKGFDTAKKAAPGGKKGK